MYEIVEQGKQVNKATNKAVAKQVAAGLAVVVGLPIAQAVASTAYSRGKVYMHNHNALNDSYANLMGLNEVKGRPTLGIKQFRRGKKLTEAVFGKS